MTQYHITSKGQQLGPFPESDVQSMLANGTIAATDLCWAEGMPDWKAVHEVIPQSRNVPPPPPVQAQQSALQGKHYGGIRRLPYFGIMIGLAIFQNVLAAGLAQADSSGGGVLFIALIFMVISFFPVYYRLKNIGMNPWWCLLMLVPIANLLVGIRCLVFQEGYEDTKKLDTAGKVITYIVLGFVILLVLGIVLAVVSS